VVANTVYIERIIMNLVINAIEASSKGEKIDMKVFNTLHPPQETEIINQEDMSKYVCIEVKDYGQGIPAEYLSRIFECGFSLKKQEAGRGVGLSGVADMVKRLDGHILVESKKNEGTTFWVYIPAN
jgi:signal transduction histidine kinase